MTTESEPTTTGQLRAEIQRQLARLETRVRSLDERKTQAERLPARGDRGRIQDAELKAELLALRCKDAEQRHAHSITEQGELARTLRRTERERDELKARVEAITDELAIERRRREAARQEVACLEEQVEQLRAMLGAMLRRP